MPPTLEAAACRNGYEWRRSKPHRRSQDDAIVLQACGKILEMTKLPTQAHVSSLLGLVANRTSCPSISCRKCYDLEQRIQSLESIVGSQKTQLGEFESAFIELEEDVKLLSSQFLCWQPRAEYSFRDGVQHEISFLHAELSRASQRIEHFEAQSYGLLSDVKAANQAVVDLTAKLSATGNIDSISEQLAHFREQCAVEFRCQDARLYHCEDQLDHSHGSYFSRLESLENSVTELRVIYQGLQTNADQAQVVGASSPGHCDSTQADIADFGSAVSDARARERISIGEPVVVFKIGDANRYSVGTVVDISWSEMDQEYKYRVSLTTRGIDEWYFLADLHIVSQSACKE